MDKATLELLVGKDVRVDRGGPESRLGKLLVVKDDYIVVYIKDTGNVYYKTEHIKSVSVDTRTIADTSVVIVDPDLPEPLLPPVIDGVDFIAVVKEMKFRWVQINRGGPEKIEGILTDVTDILVTLTVGSEIVRVMPFHIRNISYVNKNNEQQQNANGQQEAANNSKDKKDSKKDKK
ncbi:hypothetical protein ACFPES_23295 [Paenibacillus sp. GCM10023248]|uniref:hypothetical protein n=1 Tax=Bacillales TaxID=1385 RepID=UPI002379C3D7|nr:MULTISPECIES: hypothetical protein [Bacillales]MDD9269986.1 hypothetical protein [Paenibacillus sp. MAHUQ-63]MDR6883208.1 spore coat protein B [Bacillus sp. 3255]